MSSSRFPCTYERQVYIIMSPLYLYTELYGWHCMPSIWVLLWPVHAISLCCTIAGPFYIMSALHESNIGSDHLHYLLLVLLWTCFCVRQRYQYNLHITVIVTATLCLMLGHHLRLWINMNPTLGHRSYWCAVSVSTILVYRWSIVCDTGPILGNHWVGADLSCLRCAIDNGGLMYYVNRLRHWPNMKSTLSMFFECIFWLI